MCTSSFMRHVHEQQAHRFGIETQAANKRVGSMTGIFHV